MVLLMQPATPPASSARSVLSSVSRATQPRSARYTRVTVRAPADRSRQQRGVGVQAEHALVMVFQCSCSGGVCGASAGVRLPSYTTDSVVIRRPDSATQRGASEQ